MRWSAARFGAALCRCCRVLGAALRSCAALRISRRILAPLMAAAAAVWLPPAAKEGEGDCEFPLLPPWILFSPLCTAAAPLGGWRRRSGAFLRGALPLGQMVCMLLCVLALHCGIWCCVMMCCLPIGRIHMPCVIRHCPPAHPARWSGRNAGRTATRPGAARRTGGTPA